MPPQSQEIILVANLRCYSTKKPRFGCDYRLEDSRFTPIASTLPQRCATWPCCRTNNSVWMMCDYTNMNAKDRIKKHPRIQQQKTHQQPSCESKTKNCQGNKIFPFFMCIHVHGHKVASTKGSFTCNENSQTCINILIGELVSEVEKAKGNTIIERSIMHDVEHNFNDSLM